MTTPEERTRSLIYTTNFLVSLTNPKKTPRVSKEVRETARLLLRHFPTIHDVALVNTAWDEPVVRFTLPCPFEHPDKVVYNTNYYD